MNYIAPPYTPVKDWDRPIPGWSHDILPYYRRVVADLPQGAIAIEIGVYMGRSLIFFASELVRTGRTDCRIVGYDPYDDAAATEAARHLRENATAAERALIDVRRNWSVEGSRDWANASVDFVFIDGGHEYESVRDDIRAWLPKLKPGGLMAGHDYGHVCKPGEVAPRSSHPGVAQAVDELLPERALEGGAVWSYRL